MNIIDELKKNKQPLILMNSELQNAMLSMSPKEFICLQHTSTLNDPKWEANVDAEWAVDANLYNVFRLRPDYEDEPEIVECEIQKDGLGKFHYNRHDGITNCSLSSAVNYSDFIGIKFADGSWHDKPIKPVNAVGEIVFDPIFVADIISGAVRILNATHVLFRRKKQE